MGTVVVNTFRMRPGIAPERFAEFSATVDQPICLWHSDVVHRFDAYIVGGSTAESGFDADVVEVMEVSTWDEWLALRDGHPDLVPVAKGFDELVDPASVRSSFVTPAQETRHA